MEEGKCGVGKVVRKADLESLNSHSHERDRSGGEMARVRVCGFWFVRGDVGGLRISMN